MISLASALPEPLGILGGSEREIRPLCAPRFLSTSKELEMPEFIVVLSGILILQLVFFITLHAKNAIRIDMIDQRTQHQDERIEQLIDRVN